LRAVFSSSYIIKHTAAAAAILILGATALPADVPIVKNLLPAFDSSAGTEMWGYMMEGAESSYTGKEPITDLCYFRAIISYKGELIGAMPIPSSVRIAKNVRKHMVVAELTSRTLSHFILSPEYRLRKKLIESIASAGQPYDGVQIDFETVPDTSSRNYISFLKELKSKIGTKILSVAVPARSQYVAEAYDYDAISAAVDRVIVMAYDEHWGGSNPGPIASADWCERVVTYASFHIAKEKLVMGIPLYGRVWQRPRYSREITNAEVQELVKQSGKQEEKDSTGYPCMEYGKPVTVTLYYENSTTILQKVSMYRKHNVQGFAFWRLGQEPADLWSTYLSTHYAAAHTDMHTEN
jgi:spore germination protein YaaH